MLETLKAILTTRGAQLIARGLAYGCVFLAGRYGFEFAPEALADFSNGAGVMLAAIAGVVIDHYSHKKQAEAK